MKTRAKELEEMIDVVIKLMWAYTIFRTLFNKQDADRGWAVVECNAAFASGIYGCDPLAVLPVLRGARKPI